MMRRLVLILLVLVTPALFAQVDKSGGTAAHGAENEMHKQAHPDEHGAAAEEHHEKTYFGIPGWILKLANMLLFLGALGYFLGGPVKKAFAERSAAIRRAADEAKERRAPSEAVPCPGRPSSRRSWSSPSSASPRAAPARPTPATSTRTASSA